jgi:outer membrane protein insertion porin family
MFMTDASRKAVMLAAIFWMCAFQNPAPGFAQAVLQTVEFDGNRHFSQRTLLKFSGLRAGQPYSPELAEAAARKILENLAAAGYYFCNLDSVKQNWSEDSSRVSLRYYLSEGKRIVLKDLTIVGETETQGEESIRMTQPGKPLFVGELEADLWTYLTAEEENGHPFARLDLQKLDFAADSLTVNVRLIPGPRVTIGDVEIAGLEHTKPRVVARETRIRPGDLFSPARIEKAMHRVRRLPFVDEISEPALVVLGSDRYNLLFNVKEARSNTFDGVVGYQPGAQGEKGQVTGLLHLEFQNLFGTARKARIHWEQPTENRQALEFFYEEPWVLNFPFSLWVDFRQEIEDTLYLTRNISGGVNWPALEILTLKGSLFQEEVLPDSAGRRDLGLYRARTTGGALELEYDTRNVPENPTAGLYYRSYASVSRKEYESAAPQSSVDLRRYEADGDWSVRLIGRQILNLQIHGRHLQSDEKPIPLPDLYRLGGAQSLRGYREDQFAGSTTGWASLEYRFWLDKLSRLHAFFNLGYYEYEPSPAISADVKAWLWGYGVGFRQETRIGVIGFDFALGEEDVLATAKVHFRLINRF